MIQHETTVRVRYADTDQMGFVYYGKYAEYFEVGRVELVRKIGVPYTKVEEEGFLMPVAEMRIQYKLPLTYDELATIRTKVPEKPRASFLTEYEIYNEEGKLSILAMVKLAFLKKDTGRPVSVPKFVIDAVEKHWSVE